MVTVSKKAAAKKVASKKKMVSKTTTIHKVTKKVAAGPQQKKKMTAAKSSKKKILTEATDAETVRDQLVALIPEYVRQSERLARAKARLKPIATAHSDLDDRVQMLSNQLLAVDEGGRVDGQDHALILGERGKSTAISDTRMIFEKLESIREGLGWELMTFKVTDLKDYLDPEERAILLTVLQEGKRSVKVEARDHL